jgi:hypothetical protein
VKLFDALEALGARSTLVRSGGEARDTEVCFPAPSASPRTAGT